MDLSVPATLVCHGVDDEFGVKVLRDVTLEKQLMSYELYMAADSWPAGGESARTAVSCERVPRVVHGSRGRIAPARAFMVGHLLICRPPPSVGRETDEPRLSCFPGCLLIAAFVDRVGEPK